MRRLISRSNENDMDPVFKEQGEFTLFESSLFESFLYALSR